MSIISTFVESPDQIEQIAPYAIHHLIIDLPFCSVRSYVNYDWSNKELISLKKQNINYLFLNLDGIYSDHELTIILNTIKKRSLDQVFDGFRVQDLGMIDWIKTYFPKQLIHLNSEMGMQNSLAIESAFNLGLNSFTFTHEAPIDFIRTVIKSDINADCLEIFVQGPILIQYSQRRFLKNIYNNSGDSILSFDAEDPELTSRKFTFLDTPFGHFMFAHFHRSLALYRNKLRDLTACSLLIDARGQVQDYLKVALKLYNTLFEFDDPLLVDQVNQLKEFSHRNQKPSFFLSNNTDFDWRNENQPKEAPIGRIIALKKDEFVSMEFFKSFKLDTPIECINPDQSKRSIDLHQLADIDSKPMTSIEPFTLYFLNHSIKGLQNKGQLYSKNT